MTINPVILRQHVETDLDDDALQRVIDAEVEAVDLHAGDAASQTQVQTALGARIIRLRRDAASISTVTTRAHPDDDPVTLSADDYRLEGARDLVRLGSGTNPDSGWRGRVVVTFVPIVDADLRDRVVIDLAKLALEHRGIDSERAGDTAQDFGDYSAGRRKILAQLDGRRALLA